MAPEQAEGRVRDIGPHTDIYAFGGILYETADGPAAVSGRFGLEHPGTNRRGRAGAAAAFTARSAAEPGDDLLEVYAEGPPQRYPTAEALADDLRRFQEGSPVAARPVGQAERLWHRCRRKPAVAALLASLACVFLAGFAGVAWQWRVAVAATEEKELQAQTSGSSPRVVRKGRLCGQIALAQREWQDNEVAHARELLDGCRPELRGWEHAYLRRLFYSNQQTFQGHTEALGHRDRAVILAVPI